MACSCGATPCTCSQRFTSSSSLQGSIIAGLGPCVDAIRNLHTELGARRYQVFLIHTQWSGGRRGRGQESVLCEEEILPTPLVKTLEGIRREASPVGTDEEGLIRVSEISTRYSEHKLMGRADNGADIPKDQQFYYEIVSPGDGGCAPIRRRCYPVSAPNYQPTKFQWIVTLRKTNEDRTYAGDVRG